METSNWINVASVIVSIVAAVIAVFSGWKSHNLNTSTLVLTIESQLSKAEDDLLASFWDLHKAKGKGVDDPELTRLAKLVYSARQERYFNRLERLAHETLRGRLDDAEMRQQYRHVIRDTIKQYPEAYGPGSGFKSTKNLHDKWDAM